MQGETAPKRNDSIWRRSETPRRVELLKPVVRLERFDRILARMQTEQPPGQVARHVFAPTTAGLLCAEMQEATLNTTRTKAVHSRGVGSRLSQRKP